MRVFLLLLVALAIAALFTKPEREDHEKIAATLFMKGMVAGGDQTRSGDEFENWYVVSRYTTQAGGKKLLECWGGFTRFLCIQPKAEQLAQEDGD